MSDADPDPTEQRQRFAERLREAGVSTKRFINVHDGAKGSMNHDQRDPTDPSLAGNYGVYGGPGDEDVEPDPEEAEVDDPAAVDVRWLVDVDVDDYEDVDSGTMSTEGLDSLPDTFTVESPHTDGDSGGHRYYAVEGHAAVAMDDRFGRKNPSPDWGEIRVFNQYCVGPGSQISPGGCVNDWCDRCKGCDKEWCDECAKPDGGYYRIAADREIAVLDINEFTEAIATDYETDDENGAHAGATGNAPDGEDLAEQYEPDPDSEFADLLEFDHIREFIETGTDDRSKSDFSACVGSIQNGVSEEAVYEALSECPHSKVDAPDAPADYWSNTWANAHERVAQVYTNSDGSEAVEDPDTGEETRLPAPEIGSGFKLKGGCYGTTKTSKNEHGEEQEDFEAWTNFQLELRAVIREQNGDLILRVHPTDEPPYDVSVDPTTLNEIRSFKKEVCTGRTTTWDAGHSALAKLKRFVDAKRLFEDPLVFRRELEILGGVLRLRVVAFKLDDAIVELADPPGHGPPSSSCSIRSSRSARSRCSITLCPYLI